MPHTIKTAAIQMDANPAPGRLERAAALIAKAASAGAVVVALPELFNTGYQYSPANYALAEPLDGATVQWMKAQTAQYNIYLAGTLMLRENGDIFNAALLVAPDGRLWRYDKRTAWAWEHAYFREGNGSITVADTEHGKLGMLICWDSAHSNQWQDYAGKVDAMLVLSCPPKMSNFDLIFPDGTRLNTRDMGPLWKSAYTEREFFPDRDVENYAAWLGVPVVNTVGGGVLRMAFPRPVWGLFACITFRPAFWKWFRRAKEVTFEVGFDKQTKIISADGQVLARVEADGDSFTLADITLPDTPPSSRDKPPRMRTPRMAYFFSDYLAAWLSKPLYNRARQNRF